MMCRVARRYGALPHVVARWPLRYYMVVRNEMIQEWVDRADAAARARQGDDKVTDLTPQDLKKRR